jgi:hypothetical protein
MAEMRKKEGFFVAAIRIITGLVFIFSSFVKGVDPLGTAYRVEDYLGAYNWLWLIDFSLALSVLLITVEFLLGFALLFKLRSRLTSLGVLLIMMFFTIVTFVDARYNMVPDCGCFGDAIKMTPWQTFYKNIVLILFAFIIFFSSNRMKIQLPGWMQNAILILFGGAYIWFIFYNYNHLPMLDFREWKEGRDMKSLNLDKAKTYVIYKNKETGETKEYISPNYPWNDSVWMSQWEFVDQRYDDSEVVRKHHVVIEDESRNTVTEDLVENPGEQFILISYDLDGSNEGGMVAASSLFEEAFNESIDFALVTASGPETIQKYEQVFGITYPYFFADGTELKAIIRSNPGLIYLKNGVIISKWHYHDFPETLQQARNK